MFLQAQILQYFPFLNTEDNSIFFFFLNPYSIDCVEH